MPLRKKFDDAAGKVCDAVLHIKHEYYFGRGKELEMCTLSSIGFLEEISKSDLMLICCHRSGQALLALARNSIVKDSRIIGASGPYPITKSPAGDVHAFGCQVEIIDMVGTTDIEKLVA